MSRPLSALKSAPERSDGNLACPWCDTDLVPADPDDLSWFDVLGDDVCPACGKAIEVEFETDVDDNCWFWINKRQAET